MILELPVLLLLGAPLPVMSAPPQSASTAGVHAFDFNVGLWHGRIRHVTDPFGNGTHYTDLDGNLAVTHVWGGRAQLEEIEADGPNGHLEGLNLFLYNPTAKQWSENYIDGASGEPSAPLIGDFRNGIGMLYSQDTFREQSILVRATWSHIRPDSHRYEEEYSVDGGTTWAPAFIANLDRGPGRSAARSPQAQSTPHDFDFNFGIWKTHSKRLLHPLSGSSAWVEMEGTTVVRPVWDGRASLVEYSAQSGGKSVQLLSLRWYSPAAKQWNVAFATSRTGVLSPPSVGKFQNGRGAFYDTETINGHSVLVRICIWPVTPTTARLEQAFSDDGGTTWEVNWINEYTRA